jgi:5-methylcytosine-specific restriction endonuclease McrA
MKCQNLSDLADHVLLREFAAALANVHTAIAVLLAYLAEVDERKLYRPAGYTSMYDYCVGAFHMSEDTAYKRIRAARAARQFPAILAALSAGRLHVSAVVLLAPHLTPGTADDLLAAATHKTKAQIELLLAQRFPKSDVPTGVQALAPAAVIGQVALGPVAAPASQLAPGPVAALAGSTAAAPVCLPSAAPAPMPAVPPAPRARLAPLAAERFALQGTMGQQMHDKLRYAQALLSRSVPAGDVMQVLEQALDALIEKLEKRQFAACTRTRPRKSKANGRYVPAEIRRAVCQRDEGRCTFVGDHGHRCETRERLELDHVIPVARGGRTTTENLRLRCRPHNQLEAERAFGTAFMRGRREAARERARRAAERSKAAPPPPPAPAAAQVP